VPLLPCSHAKIKGIASTGQDQYECAFELGGLVKVRVGAWAACRCISMVCCAAAANPTATSLAARLPLQVLEHLGIQMCNVQEDGIDKDFNAELPVRAQGRCMCMSARAAQSSSLPAALGPLTTCSDM